MLKTEQERVGYDRFYAGALGKELVGKVQLVKAVYDFAVLGGAIGVYNLVDDAGEVITLPSGAIVKQVYTQEVTNMTGAAGAELSLGVNTNIDLLAATGFATFAGIQAGIPTGVAANMVALTADRTVKAEITAAAITAGKLNVFLEVVHVV